MKISLAIIATLLLCGLAVVNADIPVHCLFHQVFGDWTFYRTSTSFGNDVVHTTCALTNPLPNVNVEAVKLRLLAPDVVYDENGNEGFWTLIYDQGFEVVINHQKYFAFFNYTQQGKVITSNCGQTFTGWYHDAGVAVKKFGCFRGVRTGAPSESTHQHEMMAAPKVDYKNKVFTNNMEKINTINKSQKMWHAAAYPQFEGKSLEHMRRIAGGRSVNKIRKSALKAQKERFQTVFQTQARVNGNKRVITDEDIKALPKEFSWTNVNGMNLVVPVRNQGSCGSCYAFSTSDMFGSRVRVVTNGTKTPVYSPQDIVECSAYSQGCDGGFMYLIGKYAEDFGLAEESCDPYKGVDSVCKNNQCPKRAYGTNYAYTGGFYGATNAKNMMYELYHGGPLAIAFEVFDDFMNYKGGVYTHTKSKVQSQSTEPGWEETNHAVLLVGWGEENGVPYWLVKNSWGTDWGINGFFKIKRGTDECDCESEAVSADVFSY